MGSFRKGITAPGTPLPDINQPNPNNPTAFYAGGIGIEQGVCLCTGIITDNDDQEGRAAPGMGVGVEGPNNGHLNHPGEISFDFNIGVLDADFANKILNVPESSDPAVLEFQVQITKWGYLRSSYIFGSDEFPFYINDEFNDSFGILVKQEVPLSGEFENISTLKVPGEQAEPFTLHRARECGACILKKNQVAPAPEDFHFLDGGHQIPEEPVEKNIDGPADMSVPHFDHEFGGFTKLLTRETAKPLEPGTYTIKIVIQDVADSLVDAALFIPKDGVRLFTVLRADFNLDGVVGPADLSILFLHWGQSGATHTQGDANYDGYVGSEDLAIVGLEWAQTGNPDCRADFDRDGDVDGNDFLIWQDWFGMSQCASRFEGDADGDGDVDNEDLDIWTQEHNIQSGGGGGAASGGGSDGGTSMIMDLTGDGKIDTDDVALLTKSSELDQAAKDFDGDGDFDVDDLLKIQQQIDSAVTGEATLTSQVIDILSFWLVELGGIGLP